MERQTQVLDASVAVKWFCDEEDADKALRIKEDYKSGRIDLIVPELLFIELINVLKHKKADEGKLLEINDFLWGAGFKIERINKTILDSAIRLSKKYSLTIYDAIYLAVANLNSAQLISADEQLCSIPGVMSLKEVQ